MTKFPLSRLGLLASSSPNRSSKPGFATQRFYVRPYKDLMPIASSSLKFGPWPAEQRWTIALILLLAGGKLWQFVVRFNIPPPLMSSLCAKIWTDNTASKARAWPLDEDHRRYVFVRSLEWLSALLRSLICNGLCLLPAFLFWEVCPSCLSSDSVWPHVAERHRKLQCNDLQLHATMHIQGRNMLPCTRYTRLSNMSRWSNTSCLSSSTDAIRLPEACLLSWDRHKLQTNLHILGITTQQVFQISSPMNWCTKGDSHQVRCSATYPAKIKPSIYPTNQPTNKSNAPYNVWLQHQHPLGAPGGFIMMACLMQLPLDGFKHHNFHWISLEPPKLSFRNYVGYVTLLRLLANFLHTNVYQMHHFRFPIC